MAITITVEDGSVIANANSYTSVANARIYALNRGVTLSTSSDTVAAQLIKAMDYLSIYRLRWLGVRVSATQELDWPRQQVMPIGASDYLDPAVIPDDVIAAQIQLAMAQSTGMVLLPNVEPGLPIIREKIDVIETEWASPKDAGYPDAQPAFPFVDALLAPYLDGTGTWRLRTLRI